MISLTSWSAGRQSLGEMSDSDSLEELRSTVDVVGGNHHDVQVSLFSFSTVVHVHILMPALHLFFSFYLASKKDCYYTTSQYCVL